MTEKLGDYLKTGNIRIETSASSKKRALELLSESLAKNSRTLGLTEVFGSLIERERLGSTAIGNGVAIPHGRCKLAEMPAVALLKLGQGVDYEAPDGLPVDLMFALLAPEEHAQAHLDLLAQIADLCSEPDFVSALRSKTAVEDILQLIGDWEQD